VVSW